MEIRTPFETFRDVDGTPLDAGYIYIGTENQDAATNPIAVYWDAALTIPAAQPIRTIGGYPARAGAPGKIYVGSNYSITIKNSKGGLVTTSLSNSDNAALAIAALASDLANTASAAKGAGMVGVNYTLTYAAGSVGWGLTTGIQNQTATAFTSGGVAPAFTLTPAPAISAYASGQEFVVTWTASTATPTVNISGKGAKSLKHYTSRGVKVPTVVFNGTTGRIRYDGTDQVADAPHMPRALGAYRNFQAGCSGTNANITITADVVTVQDSYGERTYIEIPAVSLTLNTATVGANGMQAAIAASTWYDFGVIYNPSNGAVAAFAWPVNTTPTLPSGYTHWWKGHTFKSDGTANKYPLGMSWKNDIATYTIAAGTNVTGDPVLVTGNNFATWTAATVSNAAPLSATRVELTFGSNQTGTGAGVAPNASASYLTLDGAAAPAQLSPGIQVIDFRTFWLTLESTNVYVKASGNMVLNLRGWSQPV